MMARMNPEAAPKNANFASVGMRCTRTNPSTTPKEGATIRMNSTFRRLVLRAFDRVRRCLDWYLQAGRQRCALLLWDGPRRGDRLGQGRPRNLGRVRPR